MYKMGILWNHKYEQNKNTINAQNTRLHFSLDAAYNNQIEQGALHKDYINNSKYHYNSLIIYYQLNIYRKSLTYINSA
jgi:hypothetical protein